MSEDKLKNLIESVELERTHLLEAIKRHRGSEIETRPEWKTTMRALDKIENSLLEAADTARGGRAPWAPLRRPPLLPETAPPVKKRGKR